MTVHDDCAAGEKTKIENFCSSVVTLSVFTLSVFTLSVVCSTDLPCWSPFLKCLIKIAIEVSSRIIKFYSVEYTE